MGHQQSQLHHTVNIMEFLVAEEVDRHINQLSPKLAKYINRIEVITYALNRLPALYACSHEGWNHQYSKAHESLQEEILIAVRRGFAAVQRDPLKNSTPLKQEEQTKFKAVQAAYYLRQKLRDSLNDSTQSCDEEKTTVLKSRKPQQLRKDFWTQGSYGR